ncbi:MAG: hypothetical protein RLO50_07310 [Azospirillaceae bacterium]
MAIHFVRQIPGVCRVAGTIVIVLAIAHAVAFFAIAPASPVLASTMALVAANLPDVAVGWLAEAGGYLTAGPADAALAAALAVILGLILLVIGFRVAGAGPIAALLALACGGWEASGRVPEALAMIESGAMEGWLAPAAIVSAILLVLAGLLGLIGSLFFRTR